MDVGARLIQQPPGRPWEVNLLLGAKADGGGDIVPPTTNLSFAFPRASVNLAAVAGVCPTIRPGVFLQTGVNVCPAKSKIGSGTAHVRARDATVEAKITLYRGPGTANNFKLIVKGEAGAPLTVSAALQGTVRKVREGKFGYRADLPVIPIKLSADETVRILDFDVEVGVRRKVGGRRVAFIEAPRSCPSGGFPFQMTWSFEGGQKVTDNRAIDCVIKAIN
jgi:hypothetical protein